MLLNITRLLIKKEFTKSKFDIYTILYHILVDVPGQIVDPDIHLVDIESAEDKLLE